MFFAMAWMNAGWLAFVSVISFWAAAGWCTAALVSTYFLRQALDEFCSCAKSADCVSACGSARAILILLIITLTIALAGNVLAANGEFGLSALPMAASLVGFSGLIPFLAVLLVQFANCQPKPAPPTSPPMGPASPPATPM